MNEVVIQERREGRSLLGILTLPAGPPSAALLLPNAGLIHRIGPNRLHVELARDLAPLGVATLRLDLSGLGDSGPLQGQESPLEAARTDLRLLADALERQHGITRLFAGGVCSAADVAFDAALHDPRLCGLVLINGAIYEKHRAPGLFQQADARARRRFLRRSLLDPTSWKRLLTGRSRSLRDTAERLLASRTAQSAPTAQRTAEAPPAEAGWATLLGRGVEVLHILSEGTIALDVHELKHQSEIARTGRADQVRVEVVPGADHVLTTMAERLHVRRLVTEWAGRIATREAVR